MAERRRLPETRNGKTHKMVIEDIYGGEMDLYIRTGEYEDGKLGEIFLGIGKHGGTLAAMLDGWGEMVSVALQHGVPLETIAQKFIGSNFPPQGRTSDGENCTSLYDAIMKYLMREYLVPVS